MNSIRTVKTVYSLFITAAVIGASNNSASAQSSASCFFGDAAGFAVLASQTITNTGTTVVNGNIGIWPLTANMTTGFVEGPGKVNGITYAINADADRIPEEKAMAAAHTAYAKLMALTPTRIFGPVQELSNMTLKPGVYAFPSSAMISNKSDVLNGTLVLDDTDDPNAIFVFQITSTLVPGNATKVVMKSGGHDPNVYWVVGSSATLSTYCQFEGNIIALTDIEGKTGATTDGRLFALSASVTLEFNDVSPLFDTDGDGIPDCLDNYPYDKTRAFNNTFPSSTIAFEDQWPSKGDFDLNDLVMKFTYNVITDSKNKVVEVQGNYSLIASGGIQKNAFGIEFPIPSTSVGTIISGTKETGQTNAVFVLFSDMRKEAKYWNTQPGVLASAPVNYLIDFNITDGPLLNDFGVGIYNPFIYNMNGSSRREVHLPGLMPTTLADTHVFATGDDNSDLTSGRTYVTKSGLPWAISMPVPTFNYAAETINVTKAYKHMDEWAATGGQLFSDWFTNTAPGYRSLDNIYSAPVLKVTN